MKQSCEKQYETDPRNVSPQNEPKKERVQNFKRRDLISHLTWTLGLTASFSKDESDKESSKSSR